jgi:hypothetical protein
VKTIKRSALRKWLIMQPKHDTDNSHCRVSCVDYNLAGVNFSIAHQVGYYHSTRSSNYTDLELAVLERISIAFEVIDDVSAEGKSSESVY